MNNPGKQVTETSVLRAQKARDHAPSRSRRYCLFTAPPIAHDERIASDTSLQAGAVGRTGLMAVTGTGPSPQFLRTVMDWHSNGHDQQEAGTFECTGKLNTEYFTRGKGCSRGGSR